MAVKYILSQTKCKNSNLIVFEFCQINESNAQIHNKEKHSDLERLPDWQSAIANAETGPAAKGSADCSEFTMESPVLGVRFKELVGAKAPRDQEAGRLANLIRKPNRLRFILLWALHFELQSLKWLHQWPIPMEKFSRRTRKRIIFVIINHS